MSNLENRIIAIFLNSDDLLTQYGVTHEYHKAFGEIDDDEIKRDLYLLQKREVIIEFDPEVEVIKNGIFEHEEHGTIEGRELTVNLIDSYYALGPEAVSFIDEFANALRQEAREGKLISAMTRLDSLRIDSASWTGLPAHFSLTKSKQGSIVKLLAEAERTIEQADLSNAESAQAKAFIKSAIIMMDAPEPQPDVAWELIQRAGALAAVGQLLVVVIALFLAK